MTRSKRKRTHKALQPVLLAISDIAMAEKLLGENRAILKRFADELSTVRARLRGAVQLLGHEDRG